MEEIGRLEGRIDHIERSELTKIKEDINEIKCGQVETNTLVKQFLKSVEIHAETMDSMKMAMYEMTSSIKESNKSIKDLNTKFDDLEENVNSVSTRVKCQEEKSKIDILPFLRDKFLPMMTIFGLVVYIVLGKIGVF